MGEVVKDGPWAGFEVIHTYSRRQAIEDGVLVDLSSNFPTETKMFKWPVACTSAVWCLIEKSAEDDCTETAVYVWDVCHMALMTIKAMRDSDKDLFFTVCLPLREAGTHTRLKMVSGPGDQGEPVLTLMLPEED